MLSLRQYDTSLFFESDNMGRYKDEVTESCLKFVQHFGGHASSGVMIVLRELLVNAIQHGFSLLNQRISVELKVLPNNMFKLTVTDTGCGFDPDRLDLDSVSEDPRMVKNRGYRLIHTFAQDIEFNEKGNSITAYVPLDKDH